MRLRTGVRSLPVLAQFAAVAIQYRWGMPYGMYALLAALFVMATVWGAFGVQRFAVLRRQRHELATARARREQAFSEFIAANLPPPRSGGTTTTRR